MNGRIRGVVFVGLAFLVAACGSANGVARGSEDPSGVPAEAVDALPTLAPGATLATPDEVSVEFGGAPSAAYAGYFAADVQGFYRVHRLEATVNPLGPGVDPFADVMSPDGPEFVVAWPSQALAARDRGADVVEIAQVYRRSSMLLVSHKAASVRTVADLKGRTVTVLDEGRDIDLTAAATAAHLRPGKDYTVSTEPLDPTAFAGDPSAVALVTAYDGYAQILETTNPATGKLFTPDDLSVVDLASSTGALEDGIFARASWLAQPGNEDIAARFLEAVFEGWVYCRDQPDACAQLAVDGGSERGLGHQSWMMNEVNALIWPVPDGIGRLDASALAATVDLATKAGSLTTAGVTGFDRTDLATTAAKALGTVDTVGSTFRKASVAVTPNGE